jgi:hypothetical protein
MAANERQPQPHTAALTIATNDDSDHVFDCDDETSSKLRIECAKGDPHNALGTCEEAVEDAVASSSADKRAMDKRDESDIQDESDIERKVEELTRDASQENLEDAANAERCAEVSDVLEELIDKALCGGRTERIRDVLFEQKRNMGLEGGGWWHRKC